MFNLAEHVLLSTLVAILELLSFVGNMSRYGNTVLVHFEDMSYANLTHLFNQYRGSLACFSEDVQVLATLLPCISVTMIYTTPTTA